MTRRTLLCEKLTEYTRSLIWTDSRGPGYRHDTRDTGTTPWTCSGKRTLFASTVLAAVITVIAKYLGFVGIHHAWPVSLVPAQHEARPAVTAPTRLALERIPGIRKRR